MKLVKISRKTIFLLVVLFCASTPLVFGVFGAALKNQPGTNSGEGYGNYHSYKFERHYGSHDWVFDYALKLIDSSSTYRHYINSWLYDKSLGIKFNNFDFIFKNF